MKDINSLIVASSLALSASMVLAGAAYYVNPNEGRGSDAWDGTSPTNVVGTTIGPKRTLVGAMAIKGLASGDVIHAAEGVYGEGAEWDGNVSNRVRVVSGVGLVADGAVSETVIEGFRANGCAADSVRCVRLNSQAYVKGFTIRNGSTQEGDSKNFNAGGVSSASSSCAVIGCVITNNTCAYRGGGVYEGTMIGCLIGNNSCTSGTGPNGVAGQYFNCVIRSGYVYQNKTICNCLFDKAYFRGGDPAYNSVIYGTSLNEPVKYYRCVLGVAPKSGVAVEMNDGTVVLDASSHFTADYTLKSGSRLIDFGNNYYYENFFPTAWAHYKDVDFRGGQRVYNGTVDAGSSEYDWRGDVAKFLTDSPFLLVESMGSTVTTNAARQVVLPPSDRSFDLAWNATSCLYCERGESFSFDAQVTGTGTLTVRQDGIEEPLVVLTAADGFKTVSYLARNHRLRFFYAGEDGSATIWNFTTTAHRAFFVNPNEGKGSDAWDGTSPTNVVGTTIGPKRTLVGAMAIDGLAAGDIVHAAEGVYDEGAVWVNGVSNRVSVLGGVGLVADGDVSKTVIEGCRANGCAADSVRCVRLGSEAYVKGFTIRNGSTQPIPPTATTAEKKRYCAGGVFSPSTPDCAVVGCVITNNTCAYRGGGVYNGLMIGCLIAGNTVPSDQPGPGGWAGYYANCVIRGGYLYQNRAIINCVFDGAYFRDGDPVYNSVFFGSSLTQPCEYYRCVLEVMPTSADAKTEDGTEIWNARAQFTSDYALKAGSRLVDFGNNRYYEENFPAQWARFKDVDFRGGQRVYGGAIDAGPSEYDWRGDFAARLGGKWLSVEAASANVSTNAAAGSLALTDGGVLDLTLTARAEDTVFSLAVETVGGGSWSVTFGDETLTADADGVCSKKVALPGTYRVRISFSGAGTGTLGGFRRQGGGLILLVR